MQLKNIIKVKNSHQFLLLWFVFVSLGLVRLSSIVAAIVVKLLPLKSIQFQLLEWASIDKGTKPYELIQYGVSAFLLFCFFILIYRCFLKSYKLIDSKNITFLLEEANDFYLSIYLISLIFISLLLVFWTVNIYASVIILAFWSILVLFPIAHIFQIHSSNKKQQMFFISITCFLLAQLCYIFYPLIVDRPFILNDYMDIPEQTRLGAKYVDNAAYINSNNIGGIIKYDPRINKGSSSAHPDLSVEIEATNELLDFVEMFKHKYFYDQELKTLIISGPMTTDERDTLEGSVSASDQKQLVKLFARSNIYYRHNVNESSNDSGARKTTDIRNSMTGFSKNYSKDTYDFITRNLFEMKNQSLAGHFFHHHNYQLGPLNERVLGKEPSKIIYVYGSFSSRLLEYTMKLMGGINYKNYFNASYLFYLLYYLILTGVIATILRDIRLISFFVMIQLVALHFIGYELLLMAPGFNPLRHFLDPIILLLLYCFAKQRRPIYIFFNLCLAIFSILLNKEFGMFIFASLTTTLIFILINEKKAKQDYINYFLISIAIVATLISMVVFKQASNSLFIYTLIGVSLPPISDFALRLSMLVFIWSYLFIVKLHYLDKPSKYLLLYLLLYTQSAYVYFVWNPAPNHILVLAPIWGTMLVILIKMILENQQLDQFKQAFLLPITVAVFILLYVPSLLFFYVEKLQHHNIRKNHRVYEWNFEKAVFDSTMEPMVFENDISLINKYVPHDKAIYIISKYDNLLPFLSDKYSLMPYIEVFTSLVTRKEIDNCINTILHDKPEYVFIDTDISRNLNTDRYYEKDMINILDPALYDASRGRVIMLKYLRQVYQGVQEDYELIEKGYLISVYKKKVNSKNQVDLSN